MNEIRDKRLNKIWIAIICRFAMEHSIIGMRNGMKTGLKTGIFPEMNL